MPTIYWLPAFGFVWRSKAHLSPELLHLSNELGLFLCVQVVSEDQVVILLDVLLCKRFPKLFIPRHLALIVQPSLFLRQSYDLGVVTVSLFLEEISFSTKYHCQFRILKNLGPPMENHVNGAKPLVSRFWTTDLNMVVPLLRKSPLSCLFQIEWNIVDVESAMQRVTTICR